MISSMVLKNKLCEILNKQLFVRLPLKFYRKVSFFLQNLSRIDYNQNRNRLAMHRIQKCKKRRYGRQKWNLKKYWKYRGIGFQLDVIKEEGEKEYLAEIENDDDSLEWDEYGKPNNILIHKNSGTYFGLVKFPLNFSPSELALKRLSRGRTLQQIFPNQNDSNQETLSPMVPIPTMTDYNKSEASLLEPDAIVTETYLEALDECQSMKMVDKPIIDIPLGLLQSSSNDREDIEQRDNKNGNEHYEFRRSNDKISFVKNNKGISKNRSSKYQRKYWNRNGISSRIRNSINKDTSKETQDITANKTFEDEMEATIYKRQTGDAFERTASTISCKTEPNFDPINLQINKTHKIYASSEPDQQTTFYQDTSNGNITSSPLMAVNSDSNMVSTKPDLSTADMRILTIEREKIKASDAVTMLNNKFESSSSSKEEDGGSITPGFIECSLKLIGKSFENIFSVANLIKIRRCIKEDVIEKNGCRDAQNITLVDENVNNSGNVTTIYEGTQTFLENSTCNGFVSIGETLKSEETKDCETRRNMDNSKFVNPTQKISNYFLDEAIIIEKNSNKEHELKYTDQVIDDQTNGTVEGSDDKVSHHLELPTRSNHPPKTTTIPNYNLRNPRRSPATSNVTTAIIKSPTTTSAVINPTINNIPSVVPRLFNCSTSTGPNTVERKKGIAPHGYETRFKSGACRGNELFACRGGFVERRITGRNVVQLDHKSLWTEFVSDMIVNSRVRSVQIRGR